MKTELKAMTSRINITERTSDLEDRMMDFTQSGQQTERQIKKKKKMKAI